MAAGFPSGFAGVLHPVIPKLSTELSTGLFSPPKPVHEAADSSATASPGGSLKQRPVIAEDHAGGVVAGGAGDATAGVRAASAVVEAF